MSDTQGRAYATEENTKAGSKLEADNGFTCIKKGTICEVMENEHGLYVPCQKGTHFLDGQFDDDSKCYVGFYHVG